MQDEIKCCTCLYNMVIDIYACKHRLQKLYACSDCTFLGIKFRSNFEFSVKI